MFAYMHITTDLNFDLNITNNKGTYRYTSYDVRTIGETMIIEVGHKNSFKFCNCTLQ